MNLELLKHRKSLQEFLFIRGFLVTNKKIENLNEFPFFGNWQEKEESGFYFYNHNKTKIHLFTKEGKTAFLCGHCYDPFEIEIEEEKILEKILSTYGTEGYFDKISQITGIYVLGIVDNGKVEFLVDPSGMQSAYYAVIDNSIYITSHSQLLGDMFNLQMDEFVKKLVNYRWYDRVMGPYLPADVTPFSEVKRIVPSINYTFTDKIEHKRFWPLKEFKVANNENEYNEVIQQASDILRRNMQLISQKWSAPKISLTGG